MGLLDGKVAIITGAGRGIGAAAAKLFASQGASVIVSDLDKAPADEVVKEIADAGGQAVAVAGNVMEQSTNEALISPLVLLAFLLAIVSMKSVVAPGDIDGKPLVLTRVRAGMIIVLLIAATFLFSHPGQMGTTALLVATMAGIPAGVVLKNITGMKG